MGRAARLNPRSFDGETNRKAVYIARVDRFCESFATREEYEAYLVKAGVTEPERDFLDSRLPARLHRETPHWPSRADYEASLRAAGVRC